MSKLAAKQKTVRIPFVEHKGEKWAQLSYYGNTHSVCAERFDLKDSSWSFVGGHRVRLYKLKNNVHWLIPSGTELDISGVADAQVPRRQR